ncbi:MAG: DUF3263 domain-containing protein [Acidimicrobiales bacterium]
MELTERERSILDVERTWWRCGELKEEAIRGLSLSPSRYYRLLDLLIHRREAYDYDPLVVLRLRRRKKVRRRARYEGRSLEGPSRR